jgi:hypothetical protein
MTASRPEVPRYDDVVDLERYPIDDPASPGYRALVQACREQLRDTGAAQLPGFLTPAAVGEMLTLADRLARAAWASNQTHTVYFEAADASEGPDHPRALLQHSAKKAIAYDQVPPGAPIRRLYESDDLTGFIAAVLGKPVLYRSADPLDALEIAVFADGDELGWHFDNSEFSVTVMYRQAEDGGHFDYRPRLRTEHEENYAGVQKILHGGSDGVLRLPASPGTLAVFRGQHALHRVTPVSGPRPRINSVLTYGEHPGMKLNELTQKLFYGRTALPPRKRWAAVTVPTIVCSGDQSFPRAALVPVLVGAAFTSRSARAGAGLAGEATGSGSRAIRLRQNACTFPDRGGMRRPISCTTVRRG